MNEWYKGLRLVRDVIGQRRKYADVVAVCNLQMSLLSPCHHSHRPTSTDSTLYMTKKLA